MATVNNVRVNNYVVGNATFMGHTAWWELTRSMKKAGWKFKGSSNGTTFTTGSDPELDQWGAGTVSNAGGASPVIATPTRGRATVTALSGIVAADKGRFLKIVSGTAANNHYHQIEEVLSATSVRIDARNFAVVAETATSWDIRDPLGDAYTSFTAALNASVAWWCAQGPSVLKIPLTVAAVGTFQVGENITQAATGATGELLGYTYYKDSGWLVVAPRQRGTAGGVYGWDTSSVAGDDSLATATPSAAIVDYVYEVVIAKPAAVDTIQIFVGQFDTTAATAFSTLTPTAATMPGGGGASNVFPTHAWVMWGTTTAPGGGSFSAAHTSGTLGYIYSNYICVDAIPELGYSADGSWSMFVLTTASSGLTTPIGGILYGFQRLNDIEDGELSPYVTINPGGTKTLYANTRTSAGTLGPIAGQTDMCNFAFFDVTLSTTRVCFNGWRARSLNYEAFTEFEIADLGYLQTAFAFMRAAVSVPRIASSASPYAKPRGLVQLVYMDSVTGARIYKGTLKWIYWVSGDQVTDLYGTDPGWVQLSSYLSGSWVIGPSDGTAWFLSQ